MKNLTFCIAWKIEIGLISIPLVKSKNGDSPRKTSSRLFWKLTIFMARNNEKLWKLIAKQTKASRGFILSAACIFRRDLNSRKLWEQEKDFRPKKGSNLIDAGRTVPGSKISYEGKALDVGAYEYGAVPWTAGITWDPKKVLGYVPAGFEYSKLRWF